MAGANRARPWPTTSTQIAAVVGDPIDHSLSPLLHNAAFHAMGLDWAYGAFQVGAEDATSVVAAFRTLGLGGLSVTMPLKAGIAAAVDELTPIAAAIGAVNTVMWRGDQVVGDSTDGRGFLDALADEGFVVEGRRCVILGAGGAARALAHALGSAAAADVALVARDPNKARAAAGVAGQCGRVGDDDAVRNADLVVNATPLGMAANDELPVDPLLFSGSQLVCDLVYSPPVTPLLAAARDRGATAMNGLSMLIHQAAAQIRAWTGQEPPLDVMSAAAVSTVSSRH